MSASRHIAMHGAAMHPRAIDAERLPVPEATMFIVAASGALWALIFGIVSWLVG